MNRPLRLLLVEDSEDDALLLLRALSAAGFAFTHLRVETEAALRHALATETWDLVFSDYCLPSLDAPRAIEILRGTGNSTPLIVVSGTVGEDVAVETLKLGADDYLLKQNLTRLASAVERALQLHETRRQHRELAHMKSLIMANSLDLICSLDRDGRFLEVSGAARDILGREPADLVGRILTDFTHHEDRDRTRSELAAVVGGHETKDFENRCLHEDGRTVIMMWSAVWSPEDHVMIAVGRDVTERKRIEDALREETALFEALVESALDGILVVNSQGRKVLQNHRVTELWKIPPEIAESDDDARQVEFVMRQTKNPAEFAAKVAFLMAHPDEVSRDEVELVDGTVLDRYSAPVKDFTGRYYGRIWTFRDVTMERAREEKLAAALAQEKELAEKARAGDRAKSEFLAVMSHEVRTPLNGILGFAELLAQPPPLPPDHQSYARTIVQSGEALLRILDDILDFSRLEAGRLPIEVTTFSPRALMQDVHSLLSRQAAEKDLGLTIDIASAVPDHLKGDVGRLRQVLLNLTGNAIKFTPGGSVSLRLAPHASAASTYVFTVRDTGVGIAPEQIERVFQPFTQADSSIARRHGGAGLGLSISRRLTELIGGRLAVHSVPGQGSEFTITVPLQLAREVAAESQNARENLDEEFAARHPLRILLVEDDHVNRRLLQALIRRLGYQPLVAGNGREAIHAYETERPDCILMDLQMPEVDGIEATATIRDRERAAATHPPAFISALTANIFPADRQRCFEAGMDDYLNKPVKIATLAEVLVKASRNRSAQIAQEKVR